MVLLNGKKLKLHDIKLIMNGEGIAVDCKVVKKLEKSHNLLILEAEKGANIYGLTVGVGLNKDMEYIKLNGRFTEELIEESTIFNKKLIRAHSVGIGKPIDSCLVRGIMGIHINMLLNGYSGIQPRIVNTYVELLNKDIIPFIPSIGSIGEGDITILSHIGLTLLGEGEVIYQGKTICSSKALQLAGITPIEPWAKDSLSLLCSNAYSVAIAVVALLKTAHYINISELLYCLNLQALNGNLSPLNQQVLDASAYPEVIAMGAKLRGLLVGSTLESHDDERHLQDPLSYRCGVYRLAELRLSYEQAKAQLLIQINGSNDNPCVLTDIAHNNLAENYRYQAVLPSGNFETLPWVLATEKLSLAIAHHALASVQQIVKLNDPYFTQLTRFLGNTTAFHALGAIEKPAVALAMRIKNLAMPVSLDYFPVAGGIEDTATNAQLVAEKLQSQLAYGYELISIVFLCVVQAINLRKEKEPFYSLSSKTEGIYRVICECVDLNGEDKSLSKELRQINDYILSYEI
ncbi:HAL/PAL/TAL family ammonia-lyase [Providencia rettgeri]|uniref:HAL/PAL/TAL family ammonia-lyase n=1 Tax=Providencia rettgeri TaxID=587 RepID=UPI002360C2D0|nr:aromatic amino acid ammonia-lyase [Providencia rettgeri]